MLPILQIPLELQCTQSLSPGSSATRVINETTISRALSDRIFSYTVSFLITPNLK